MQTLIKRLAMVATVIVLFSGVANAQTVDDVRKGLLGIQTTANVVKLESCPRLGSDRKDCEEACEASAQLAGAMAITIPILIDAHEKNARTALFAELKRRLELANSFEKRARQLSQR